jgi:hypothetical protein
MLPDLVSLADVWGTMVQILMNERSSLFSQVAFQVAPHKYRSK